MPNLKYASLVILELLAFNAQKITGHVTLATAPFRKNFQWSGRDFPLEHAYVKFEVRTFSHFGAISI